MNQNYGNIRKRIIVPLIFSLVVLLTVSLFNIYLFNHEQLRKDMDHETREFHEMFPQQLNIEARFLAEQFLVLKNNPDISADLVDLRTLVPLDKNLVLTSVKKTGRAIVLHEDCMIGGFGADLASIISDECFEYLDAPVKRSASMDTPVPFAYELEDEFLAKARFEKQLIDLLKY